jgi:hypothetical protein
MAVGSPPAADRLVTVMDLLLEFAGTGRIRDIQLGMSLEEAEKLLGPGVEHPAISMFGPAAEGHPYPYSWRNLDLLMTRRTVTGIDLSIRPGQDFGVPQALWPGDWPVASTVTREDTLAALATAQHEYEPFTELGSQSSVRIRETGVVIRFFDCEQSETVEHPGLYLTGAYKVTETAAAEQTGFTGRPAPPSSPWWRKIWKSRR